PEDVVVGANLAAVLGNLAYKTQAVQILNTDKLGTSATGGTLDDKEVGLTITTPGVNPATAYEMKAYVEDDLDFSVDSNRSTGQTSRFQPGVTSFGTGLGPKVITKDLTSIVAPAAGMPSDGKITYPKGSTNTKEEQKVYAFAYVKYDETARAVQAQYVKTGYEVVFSDPIPICLDTSKGATLCTTDSDMLKKGNVEISFLGDKWTIFDYTAATITNSVTSVTLGKQITRKESFNIDEQVTTQEGYVITLKDLSAFSPQRAQFDITDKDGVLVKRLYLGEGDSSTITEANNIVVTVNKVFPGAFAKQGIADVSLYSSQLVLNNGAEVSGGDSHDKWYSNIVNATVGSTQGISKIQLYNNLDQTYKNPLSQTLVPGESIEIIKGMPGYKLNFLGLEAVDYDTLSLSIYKAYSLYLDDGASISANVLGVVSGKSNAFQYGSRSVNDAYILLEGATGNSTIHPAGEVFYINAAGAYTNASTTMGQLTYYYSSEENAVLFLNTSYNHTGAGYHVLISIPELTETNNGTSATAASNFHLNLLYDTTLDQFVNTIGSTTVDKIGYDNGVPTGFQASSVANIASKDPKFTTRRGNIFTGIGSTSATISYAKKLAQARFTLTTGASGTSGSGSDAAVILKEGDPYTIGGGYSLMVDSITATIAGGDAGDITGIDELAPSVSEAAVVTALNTASNPLVVLDSQASDTANLIVVGGQIVNTVANAAGVNLKTGDQPEVMVYGTTKLVVAGYSAADTSEAGNALINWLNANRDSVRG
ncbi:MAG: hypothetical protein ABH863_03605, partial [Candidatus Micrarchaeota archaeon]